VNMRSCVDSVSRLANAGEAVSKKEIAIQSD